MSDALRPGLGTGFEARCGAGAAAVVLAAEGGAAALGARVTHSPPARRPLPRRRRDRQPRPLRRRACSARRSSCRVVARGRRARSPRSTSRAWSLPDPDGRLGAVVAKKVGADARRVGRRSTRRSATPARRPRCSARSARSTPPGAVAIVGTGGGRTTGVLVDVERAGARRGRGRRTRSTAAGPRRYAEVLRARGQLVAGGETIPMGVPPESAMFVRGADEMLGLLGGRCVDCGTISTPPSIHPHCINCGGPKLEPVALARGGAVHTYVVNQTMPAPFVAPLPIAVLDMDDGARLMLQVVGDGADVEIGRRVELVLRKYAHERGVPVYGFKARPVRGGAGGVVMAWNKVAVVGAGLIKMGELFDQSYEQMAAGAFDAAVASVDKGFEPQPGRRRVRRDPAGHAVGPGRHRRQHDPDRDRPRRHPVHAHRERVPVGLRRVPRRRDGGRERRARRRARDRRREDARQVDRGGPALAGRGRATRSSPAARPRRCCSRRSRRGTCTSSARRARCSRRSR